MSDVSLVKWDKLGREEGGEIIMEHEQEEEELNSNSVCLGGGEDTLHRAEYQLFKE